MVAVSALVEGRDRVEVAALFKVSVKAVDNWWAKWRTGGQDALLSRPRGRRVGELIFKLHGVRFTEPGVGKYLKRWGLTSSVRTSGPSSRTRRWSASGARRPCRRSGPGQRRKGEVLFADQVGVRSDQVTGRTWGEQGKTPVVRRIGNRFSVNAMSAISTRGRMHFMVFTASFDAKVMCRFLARLVGHFDRKVHLIVDRHSAHRSKTVRAWLADHKDEIELHFLPSVCRDAVGLAVPGQQVAAMLAKNGSSTPRTSSPPMNQPRAVRARGTSSSGTQSQSVSSVTSPARKSASCRRSGCAGER